MDDSVKRVEVKVQPKSGFDKSFGSMGTAKVGNIVPVFVDEVIPNSTVNLKVAMSATLPPLASETFMKCSLKCEAFFVPMRLLFGSFEHWFCDNPIYYAGANSGVSACPPAILVDDDATATQNKIKAAGSLSDYLGIRTATFPQSGGVYFSAMPFLAYHRVYDDWYRRADLEKEVFAPVKIGATPAQYLRSAPFVSFDTNTYLTTISSAGQGVNDVLNDGHNIFDMRQRNFDQDYFTVAKTNPQWGTAQKVTIQTGSPNYFTIASLRAQNSLQQFEEQNNLVSPRTVEVVKVRYGANLSDGVAQRSLLIGTAEFELYSKGVYVTADNSGNQNIANPFGDFPGSQFGAAYASGSDFIIKGFTANEPGYLFVMASLVPRVTYSSGIRRYITNYIGTGCLTDMPNPLLQNTGNEPIYQKELTGVFADNSVFGYTERYSWMKTRESELHGILRDGQSLQCFALQRTFASNSSPQINSSFIKIPTSYLDQVAASTGLISGYGFWYDAFFDYKVSMPLAKYSIPSLQNPAYEHGYSVNVKRNGVSL